MNWIVLRVRAIILMRFVETEHGKEHERLRSHFPLSPVSRYLHRGVFCLSPESIRNQQRLSKSQCKLDVRAIRPI